MWTTYLCLNVSANNPHFIFSKEKGGGRLIVLYIFLCILGALILLLIGAQFIRVGVYISFGEELRVRVKVGPVTRQILPKSDKPKKPKKQKKPKSKKESKEESEEKPKKKKLELTFDDIRSAFPALFESLKKGLHKTRKRLKIHPMTLSITFGGDDPAKVSEMYGWGCTAMWTAMPQLEQLIRMPDPRIHLDVDYSAWQTRAEGEIGISLLVHDGIGIVGSFGIPLIKWYLSTKKNKAKNKKSQGVSSNQDQQKGE